jgi:hypothetical protein
VQISTFGGDATGDVSLSCNVTETNRHGQPSRRSCDRHTQRRLYPTGGTHPPQLLVVLAENTVSPSPKSAASSRAVEPPVPNVAILAASAEGCTHAIRRVASPSIWCLRVREFAWVSVCVRECAGVFVWAYVGVCGYVDTCKTENGQPSLNKKKLESTCTFRLNTRRMWGKQTMRMTRTTPAHPPNRSHQRENEV